MDRYDLVNHRWNDGVIDNETGIEYFADDLLVDHLNTLTRELAESQARVVELENRIQRATNEVEGCDYDGQSGICARVADILED